MPRKKAADPNRSGMVKKKLTKPELHKRHEELVATLREGATLEEEKAAFVEKINQKIRGCAESASELAKECDEGHAWVNAQENLFQDGVEAKAAKPAKKRARKKAVKKAPSTK